MKLFLGLLVISSTCHFINLSFHLLAVYQLVISSTCGFCQLAISSTFGLCQLVISSAWHFINLPFHQPLVCVNLSCPLLIFILFYVSSVFFCQATNIFFKWGKKSVPGWELGNWQIYVNCRSKALPPFKLYNVMTFDIFLSFINALLCQHTKIFLGVN